MSYKWWRGSEEYKEEISFVKTNNKCMESGLMTKVVTKFCQY